MGVGYRAEAAPNLTASVVIPTYNRVALLARAVDSAVKECLPGDEVIVVDDGSTDGTEALLAEWGPPVRHLRIEHQGAGAARNAGVDAARGDLVAFLDSDDEWVAGKLGWQRAVMASFPDLLYLFSDFGNVTSSGERQHHHISSWRHDPMPWDEIFSTTVSSDRIPGMPDSAPRFTLYMGDLYETYIEDWSVYTCTVVVRRDRAGAALRFPEDVPTYEDVECFARLAGSGMAGYMDCETAWQHGHTGPRLTDADAITNADTAMKIIGRVWGADSEYLASHRDHFEAVMDVHRARKLRVLLRLGCSKQARQELPDFFNVPRGLGLLCHVPGSLLRVVADMRDAWRRARTSSGVAKAE
jgi:glycosyltransferase involved in cell wall biosynthesis